MLSYLPTFTPALQLFDGLDVLVGPVADGLECFEHLPDSKGKCEQRSHPTELQRLGNSTLFIGKSPSRVFGIAL